MKRPLNVLPPTEIMILAQTYTVTLHDKIDHAHHGLLNGMTDTDQSTIDLSLNQSPSKFAETLLHEVLHATMGIGPMQPGGDKQETLVAALSPMLLHVLRANPGMVEFLMERKFK